MQKNGLSFIVTLLVFSQGYAQTTNPEILWATYFGSPGNDFTGQVVTDEEDNIYMTSTVRFGAPATPGVHQTNHGGGSSDAMLSKFDKDGDLIWSTYFGGSGKEDSFYALSLMSDGAIVISGITTSNNKIATQGAHDESYGGGSSDVFIAVFETDGKLRWATYFGGNGVDGEPSVTIDLDDNIFLVGYTTSTNGISTMGSFQSVKSGGEDGFLAKFDKDGTLVWSTYYGGSNSDFLSDVVTDIEGNIYVSGATLSTNLATQGAFNVVSGGKWDALIVKFDNDGKRIWSSYYGNSQDDFAWIINMDKNDNLYVLGYSESLQGIATSGAYSEVNAGKQDIFIAKFTKDGEREWATFIGGESWDAVLGIDFDNNNNFYLAALSKSYSFPITEFSLSDTYQGGEWDAVFMKWTPKGELVWCTYFGGEGNDRAIGISLDSEQNIVASINTDSKGLATPGAYNEIAIGNESLLIKMKDATIVSVKELESLHQLTIFPNPTTDYIEISNGHQSKRTMSIYDLNGALVFRYINTNQIRFDIRNLKAGLYFLHSIDNKVESFGKFIKID